MCIIIPANATSFAIGLVAHKRVNKDGPRVRGVLIPAEPASKSGRARHNSSFARLAGITVTYFLSPFPSFSPNFISRVCCCLALYSANISAGPYLRLPASRIFRTTNFALGTWDETTGGSSREIDGNSTCLNNYSLSVATLLVPTAESNINKEKRRNVCIIPPTFLTKLLMIYIHIYNYYNKYIKSQHIFLFKRLNLLNTKLPLRAVPTFAEISSCPR